MAEPQERRLNTGSRFGSSISMQGIGDFLLCWHVKEEAFGGLARSWQRGKLSN